MNCGCTRLRYHGILRKTFKDSSSVTGYTTCWSSKQRPSVSSAEAQAELRPETYELVDCDKCKHQLACLLYPECNRRFEGKV